MIHALKLQERGNPFTALFDFMPACVANASTQPTPLRVYAWSRTLTRIVFVVLLEAVCSTEDAKLMEYTMFA